MEENVQEKALEEFDGFVDTLRKNGVTVTVVDDTRLPETPDSIFPNNWISLHQDGRVVLYPMFSENRRAERRQEIWEQLAQEHTIQELIDLSAYESEGLFLEGTGSMVLDREAHIAYACLSVRTSEKVIADFCARLNYKSVVFHAVDQKGFPIYHTNVMMCIGDRFAVLCLDAVADDQDKAAITDQLHKTDKALIEISFQQMNAFAGNMLQVKNEQGEELLVMSEQAYRSLTATQVSQLEHFCRIVYAPLYTIEKNGGGSARCMLAEVHLPLK